MSRQNLQLGEGLEKPPSRVRVYFKKQMNRWMRRRAKQELDDTPKRPQYRHYS